MKSKSYEKALEANEEVNHLFSHSFITSIRFICSGSSYSFDPFHIYFFLQYRLCIEYGDLSTNNEENMHLF